MATRFIFSATCAATLHLALLFGARWPHEIKFSMREPSHPPFPATWIAPDETQVEINNADDDAARPKKGDIDEARPVQEEPLIKPASNEITQPFWPVDSNPKTDQREILPGVVGKPEGITDSREIGPTNVIDPAKLDNPPRTRLQIRPDYPAQARKEGCAAEVRVEFWVDERGAVHEPRVVSSTDARFEHTTLLAVARWRFEPGRNHGRLARFRMLVPISFSLNE